MSGADASARAFVVANTRLLTPPLVPELTLRLADEAVPIWRKTETRGQVRWFHPELATTLFEIIAGVVLDEFGR